ncbi:MAG: type II secretion system minor pseudopilin GspI [Enterobacteriaceae bacterium]
MKLKNRGMTLLEVMVAVVIFSLAALALFNAIGEQVRGVGYLQQKTVSLWVADNQLSLVLLVQPWPQEGWHSGESEMAGATWYWRWRGVQTSDEHMRAVEVEVRAQKEDDTPLARLRTYVIRP